MLVTAARPGDKLYVVCSWQTEAIPAEILERRLKDSKQGKNTQKKKNSGEGAGSSNGNRSVDDKDSLSADKFEYYVHFIGFDRRLDEWVEPGRIHFGSVVDDELLRSEDKGLARPRKIRRRSETADDVEEKEKRLADLEKRNASITKVTNPSPSPNPDATLPQLATLTESLTRSRTRTPGKEHHADPTGRLRHQDVVLQSFSGGISRRAAAPCV